MSKKKRKARKKEPNSFLTGLKLFGCFFVVLLLGWYMIVDHIEGDFFQGVVELPLKEIYANALYGWALIHWVIGIPAIIVALVLIIRESKREFMATCIYSVPLFLLSMSFTIQYMVFLIKVDAEFSGWLYIVVTTIGFILVNIFIYLDKTKIHSWLFGLGLVLVSLSWVILIISDSAVGNYIITYKSSLRGSLMVKTIVGTFQTLGIFIFLAMYGYLLKLRLAGEE
ncbi:hypothetical protein [Robertmurraya sp. P23]|uniref:hypothetical protein n=1 Tax=Robertmurraya sp. P23 TaxID=3436931 RepID=UPI003D95659B